MPNVLSHHDLSSGDVLLYRLLCHKVLEVCYVQAIYECKINKVPNGKTNSNFTTLSLLLEKL